MVCEWRILTSTLSVSVILQVALWKNKARDIENSQENCVYKHTQCC